MIAQLNCFTFGYLFLELVVGSPVGMRNFLYVALAPARSRLGPIFFSELGLPPCTGPSVSNEPTYDEDL